MSTHDYSTREAPKAEPAAKQGTSEATNQAAPPPREQAKPPQAFYRRLTKRADVRRLLAKLAQR